MSRRPGRWWRPQGPQHRRPARVSRARAAYHPDVQWMKGWDQGVEEGRSAFEGDGLDHALDVAMRAGQMEGRKLGERDAYRHLAELLDDPDALAAEIGGRALVEDVDLFLTVESAARNDPDGFRRLCEAVEEGPEAEHELAEEWGVAGGGRQARKLDLVRRLVVAMDDRPEAFEALAAELGVPADVLRTTPVDELLDVVDAAGVRHPRAESGDGIAQTSAESGAEIAHPGAQSGPAMTPENADRLAAELDAELDDLTRRPGGEGENR